MPKISLSNTDRHHERFDFSVIANLKIVVLIEKILAWEIQIEQLFVTSHPFLVYHITVEVMVRNPLPHTTKFDTIILQLHLSSIHVSLFSHFLNGVTCTQISYFPRGHKT